MKGQDYLYIGLGLGAIYLISKLTKPVTDVAEDISQVTGAVSDGVTSGLSDVFTIGQPAGQMPNLVTGGLGDWLVYGSNTVVPAITDNIRSFTNKVSSTFQRSGSSSKVASMLKPTRVGIIGPASADVPASVRKGYTPIVSPFTGKAAIVKL